MKFVMLDPVFGKVIWELPDELARQLGVVADEVESRFLGAHLPPDFAREAAGQAENVLIHIVQDQVRSFMALCVRAHISAKQSEPPGKFVALLNALLEADKRLLEREGME